MEILRAREDVSNTYLGRRGFSPEACLLAGLRAHDQWHWEAVVKEGNTGAIIQ